MKAQLLGLFFLLGAFIGCSKSIPRSQCSKIVDHAQKVLNGSESRSKLMSDCQGATDKQRGCAMSAKNGISLAACMK